MVGGLSPHFFTPLLLVVPSSTAYYYYCSPPPFSSSISLPIVPNTHSSSSSSLVWSPRQLYVPLKPPVRLLRKAAEYVFPDPLPEFAESETNKFRMHLLEKLCKKKKQDMFGDSLEEVVRVCSEILNNFLQTEYGGPGTLLVVPFIDMADTLNERGLPGGPQAARAAVVWAQEHLDKDWNKWISGEGDRRNDETKHHDNLQSGF